jgi:hypothetical protein
MLGAAFSPCQRHAIAADNTRPQVASNSQSEWVTIPDQRERTWTDFTGRRQTKATLLAASAQSARFRRHDGFELISPTTRLSSADRAYVQSALRDLQESRWSKSLLGGVSDWLGSLRTDKRSDTLADGASPAPAPANVVYVRLSEPLLRRFAARDVNRQSDVADRILGTSIFGTAATTGRIELALIPDSRRARADLLLRGTSNSTTTGYNGPVRIHSRGVTRFASRKSLWLDEQGVHTAPARTNAITTTQTTGISTNLPGLRRRIALRIASRRIAASRSQADAIASQRAAARVGREWDRIVDRQLSEVTQSITAQFVSMAVDPKRAASRIEYSTTAEYLELIVFRREAASELIAKAPPRAANRPDVEVQLHTSLVRNPVVRSQLPVILRSVVNSFIDRSAVKTAVAESTPNVAENWSLQSAADAPWITLVWNRPAVGGSQGTRIADRR